MTLATSPEPTVRRVMGGCHCGTSVYLPSAFEHRLGQLLDEQRHSVSAPTDLRNDIGAKLVACQVIRQRRAVTFAKPTEG
jgi:hypothetical protein